MLRVSGERRIQHLPVACTPVLVVQGPLPPTNSPRSCVSCRKALVPTTEATSLHSAFMSAARAWLEHVALPGRRDAATDNYEEYQVRGVPAKRAFCCHTIRFAAACASQQRRSALLRCVSCFTAASSASLYVCP